MMAVLLNTKWKFKNILNDRDTNLKSYLDYVKSATNLPPFIVYQFEKLCDRIVLDAQITDLEFNNIELVLDYLNDELNTGPWFLVDISIRRAYAFASYLKIMLHFQKTGCTDEADIIKCIKIADTGLLMGAPFDHEEKSPLTIIASLLTKSLEILKNPSYDDNKTQINADFGEVKYNCSKINDDGIETSSCPSVDHFHKYHFIRQIPLKLTDCIENWPAVVKWSDVSYLKHVAGERTVPVELGSRYTDENWTQKLMTLKQFIDNYFVTEKIATNVCGYLAQHNLFDQIPELRDDILTPDYCALSDNYDDCSDPSVNAWFGPKGTVSPLHYDPDHNLLAQVFGCKEIYLFDPKDSEFLYPHEGKVLKNTAQVDPSAPDIIRYPKFRHAKAYKCILHPKEMLYIPPKWWHHVTSLDPSFSVSFWWK